MADDIPPIVSVDSMTLVWGIREDGPEEDCQRAKWLLTQFTARETQVILSTVALAEYLTPADPAAHADMIEKLNERFIIKPLDEDCAALAAELWRIGNVQRPKNITGGRAILRADTMIVATAKVFGAGRLYSYDENCRKLANAIRPDFGCDLPTPPRNLYGEADEHGYRDDDSE